MEDGDEKSSDWSQTTDSAPHSSSITNPNYCGPDDESPQTRVQQMQMLDEGDMVLIYCNTDFLFSCSGFLRLFQVLLSLCCFLAIVTCSGIDGGDFLSLPQNWHVRVLVFVIMWSSLSSFALWGIKVTGSDQMLPVNWWLLDFLLYSMFSLSYLISTSIVANYVEQLKLMEENLPEDLSTKFIISIIIGYICVLVYGLTAFVGYRRWRIQRHLFRRRQLLESEDFMEVL